MAFTTGFWAADTEGTVDNLNKCLLGYGPVGDFPAAAAGNKGMLAYATDTYKLYYSTGGAWVELTNGKYTEITAPPSQAGAAAWADFNLSGSIPVGAKSVVIQLGNIGAVQHTACGCRKNGSTSTYTIGDTGYFSMCWVVELDTNRIIEIIDAAAGTFYAIGYFS